jgi:hypothetical protein
MEPLITQPGFYPDLTCDQYFAEPCPAPALTNSGIKLLLNSCPAKFAHGHPAIGQQEAERQNTAAMYRGKLVHRLALDKGDDYAISPYDEYRTKEAKAWRDEARDAGLMPVKRADFNDASVMASAIRESIRTATKGHDYQTEVVIAWQRDMPKGLIWCRAMVDVWCPSLNLALDVKTCADAGDKAVNRAFANGYAGQHDWYKSGLEALTGEPGRTKFGFLFVETVAPFLERYAESGEAFRWGAQQLNEYAADTFATCLNAGNWPGYGNFNASPPAWWVNDLTNADYQKA